MNSVRGACGMRLEIGTCVVTVVRFIACAAKIVECSVPARVICKNFILHGGECAATLERVQQVIKDHPHNFI